MATAEQWQQLQHQEGEWVRQIFEQQTLALKMMLDQFQGVKNLDECSFRELGEVQLNVDLFQEIMWAEASEDEITMKDVE